MASANYLSLDDLKMFAIYQSTFDMPRASGRAERSRWSWRAKHREPVWCEL